MYFIKKILIDENSKYLQSYILSSAKFPALALTELDQCAINYVREECGNQIADKAKIIDILNMDQVNEPLVDTMLLYRLMDDPHRIHVFQRKTEQVSGVLYGYHLVSKFHKVALIELEESESLASPTIEPQSYHYPALNESKDKTFINPMIDVISELKGRFNSQDL